MTKLKITILQQIENAKFKTEKSDDSASIKTEKTDI